MNNLKSITKSELLVYIFFSSIAFCKGIGLDGSNNVYKSVYLLGVIIIGIKILKDKFYLKELFSILCIVLIGILDFVVGKSTTVLFTALSICCLKNINLKKIIKIIFYSKLVAFLLMMFLSSFGIIENSFILHYREEIGFIKRYCFGYSHPNLVHSTFTTLIFLFGYLYYKKINLFTISIIEILNIILYNLTFSRTGFLILTIYLLFIYITKKSKFIKKKLPKILKISFPFLIFLSLFLAVFYSKFDFIKQLDSLVTGRINYMHILISNYMIPVIGSNFYNSVVLFDNGYFSMFYEGGILATIWFVYFQLKTNKFLIENNMNNEIIITIFFLIYCMLESYYISLVMNPTLIFFCYCIFNRNARYNKI